MFGVVVPDCTKAIVHTADPRKPRIIDGFLEYVRAPDDARLGVRNRTELAVRWRSG